MTLALDRVHCGDCVELLRQLDAKSVQCVVTSPPYLWKFDYGVMPSEWPEISYIPMIGLPEVVIPPMTCCLGLEPSPFAYISHLVHVFRQCRPVIRKDGVMWINIADTSAGTGKSGGGLQGEKHEIGGFKPTGPRGGRWLKAPKGYKNKDIIGVSWMLAFALQADGWYFRMDNVWEKTNGMPSSATDRPTKVHEYVFLLSKSKNYYYDGEAISEPSAGWKGSSFTSERDFQRHPNTGRKERKPYKIGLVGERENRGISSGPCTVGRPTRNKRSVWRIATATSDFEDHMATFPEEFANICIKAGSRPGDVIIDPFAGTGTMIEAALKNNRHGIGFELKPSWADGANHSIRGWRTLSNFAMEG